MSSATSYYFNKDDFQSNVPNQNELHNKVLFRYKIIMLFMTISTIPLFFISILHLINGGFCILVISLGMFGVYKKNNTVLSIFQVLSILVWIFTLTVFIFGIIEISNGQDIKDPNKLFFNYNLGLIIVGVISSCLWLTMSLGTVGLSLELQRIFNYNKYQYQCIIHDEPLYQAEYSQPLRSSFYQQPINNYGYNTFPQNYKSNEVKVPQEFVQKPIYTPYYPTTTKYQHSKYQLNYPSPK